MVLTLLMSVLQSKVPIGIKSGNYNKVRKPLKVNYYLQPGAEFSRLIQLF